MIEIINKIRTANAVINRDLSSIEPRFRPGHEAAKREAATTVEKLAKSLSEEISGISVPVYINGTNARNLAEAMGELTPSAIVDLNVIYKPIIESVAATIGRSREFGPTQFSVMVKQLRDLATENGLPSMGNLKFGEPVIVTSPEFLEKTVLQYVASSVGSDLAVNYIRKQAAEQAVKVVSEKIPVFPVFVLNSNVDHHESLTKKLFKRNVEVVLDAPAEITEKVALNSLNTVKKSLKNTKE